MPPKGSRAYAFTRAIEEAFYFYVPENCSPSSPQSLVDPLANQPYCTTDDVERVLDVVSEASAELVEDVSAH